MGDFFSALSDGSRFIFRMLGVMLMLSLLIGLTCGLGAFVAWPVPFLLLHKDLVAMETISEGWAMISSRFGEVLLIGLTCFGIALVSGFVPFGGIFAIPLVGIIQTVGYMRLVNEPIVVPSTR